MTAAHADRNGIHAFLFVVLEGQDLAECPHIDPFFACRFSERLRAPCLFRLHVHELFRRRIPLDARAYAVKPIIGAVIGLHEDLFPRVLQTVANLALQAYIRDLAVVVIIRAWLVPIQRIAVRIGALDRDPADEVDLLFQCSHHDFPSSAFSVSSISFTST